MTSPMFRPVPGPSATAAHGKTVYQVDELVRKYGEACFKRESKASIDKHLNAVRAEIETLRADAMSWRMRSGVSVNAARDAANG